MASKGSYFQQHKEKIHGEGYKKLPIVSISDEQRLSFTEGRMLMIDKPLHWTSFDVVRKIRNTIQIKKVGHAGTLDPLATGLLIVCTGKFTKKINEYMAQQKEYTGTITLGAVTPTYDLESQPEQLKDTTMVTGEQIEKARQQFTGDIMQVPPIFAAIKKDGEAMYQLARRGEAVKPEARPVTIHAFEITGVSMPMLHFRVLCSTGTYIRSLAHDVGAALGCGGYLSELRRTAIGNYSVKDAVTPLAFLASLEEENQKG